MKKILLLSLLALFSCFAIAGGLHTNDVQVNPKKSTVKWKGSKPTSSHSGTINISTGKLVFDHGRLVGGEFVIDMNTIQNTDIESERKRASLVEHLKDEDFFNVEEFPTAELKIINAAAMSEDNVYKMEANLTIKGITNKIAFSAIVVVKRNDFLAEANFKIDRTKWGIKYGSGSFFEDLGNRMILDDIEFDIVLSSEK